MLIVISLQLNLNCSAGAIVIIRDPIIMHYAIRSFFFFFFFFNYVISRIFSTNDDLYQQITEAA